MLALIQLRFDSLCQTFTRPLEDHKQTLVGPEISLSPLIHSLIKWRQLWHFIINSLLCIITINTFLDYLIKNMQHIQLEEYKAENTNNFYSHNWSLASSLTKSRSRKQPGSKWWRRKGKSTSRFRLRRTHSRIARHVKLICRRGLQLKTVGFSEEKMFSFSQPGEFGKVNGGLVSQWSSWECPVTDSRPDQHRYVFIYFFFTKRHSIRKNMYDKRCLSVILYDIGRRQQILKTLEMPLGLIATSKMWRKKLCLHLWE